MFQVPLSAANLLAVAAQEIGNRGKELAEDVVLQVVVVVAAEFRRGRLDLVEGVGEGEFLGAGSGE